MPPPLNIALLAHNPKLYSNQRLMEEGQKRGHNMQFLNITQCSMSLNTEHARLHHNNLPVISLNAIIPRIPSSMTFYGCSVIRQCQAMGITSLNEAAPIAHARNKLHALQSLCAENISIPKTHFVNFDTDEPDDIIQAMGGTPLIFKLLQCTHGKGVMLARNHEEAIKLIKELTARAENFILQEFIEESAGSDVRCFIIDGEIIGAMERTASNGDFRSNLHLGGKAIATTLSPDEKHIALKATDIMGLRVAGVDLIRSKDGPKILEINSSPGLEGIEAITGKNIAGLMIKSLEASL